MQPVYYIHKADAMEIVRKYQYHHINSKEMGYNDVNVIIDAIYNLPIKLAPDLIDLAKACSMLQTFHTYKAIGGANRDLMSMATQMKAKQIKTINDTICPT